MSEPTIEQLANFASVRIASVSGLGWGVSADLIRAMFEADPLLVENWRTQHAAFQAAADELAERACKWCQGAGIVPIDGVDEECLRCGGTGEATA